MTTFVHSSSNATTLMVHYRELLWSCWEHCCSLLFSWKWSGLNESHCRPSSMLSWTNPPPPPKFAKLACTLPFPQSLILAWSPRFPVVFHRFTSWTLHESFTHLLWTCFLGSHSADYLLLLVYCHCYQFMQLWSPQWQLNEYLSVPLRI